MRNMRDLVRVAFSDAIDLERVGSRAGVKVCGRYYSWKPVSWRKYSTFGVKIIWYQYSNSPVDDFVLMEILEAKYDTKGPQANVFCNGSMHTSSVFSNVGSQG